VTHTECLLLQVTQENIRHKQVRWTSYSIWRSRETKRHWTNYWWRLQTFITILL